MLSLGGYLAGQRIGTMVVGNDEYRDDYTVEEYHLLKEQLFGW